MLKLFVFASGEGIVSDAVNIIGKGDLCDFKILVQNDPSVKGNEGALVAIKECSAKEGAAANLFESCTKGDIRKRCAT